MATPSSRQLRPRKVAQPVCSPVKPCASCLPMVARRLPQKGVNAPTPESDVSVSGQDPVDVLGEDVFLCVLGFLPPRDLVTCTLVCKTWGWLAREDKLWSPWCEKLCFDKAAVPKGVFLAESKMAAFGLCIKDAARTTITLEDLCGTAFEFRFKWPAGDFWRNIDPSWRSEPPFIRIFHPNNVVSPGPNDTVFNDMTWKFTKTKDRKPGCYVQINQWPSLSITRTKNWGWILQNCWVTYTSMPDSDIAKRLPKDLHELILSRR